MLLLRIFFIKTHFFQNSQLEQKRQLKETLRRQQSEAKPNTTFAMPSSALVASSAGDQLPAKAEERIQATSSNRAGKATGVAIDYKKYEEGE